MKRRSGETVGERRQTTAETDEATAEVEAKASAEVEAAAIAEAEASTEVAEAEATSSEDTPTPPEPATPEQPATPEEPAATGRFAKPRAETPGGNGAGVRVLVVEPMASAEEAPTGAERERAHGTTPGRLDLLEGVDDPALYRREAAALAESQPERAALMYMEAAASGERLGLEGDPGLGDIRAALALQPESAWLLPLARRALMRRRHREAALEIAAHEVALGGSNAHRAAVLQEAASLVRHQLGDQERALGLLEDALALEASDVVALDAASALRLALERWETAVEGLERLAGLLGDPQERALYAVAAGTLREARLGQDDEAEADYRLAVESDRQNLAAALLLVALRERRGAWSPLTASLEHLATLAPDPAEEARLLHQAGSLHLDVTRDLEAALRDLRRAVEAAPDEPSYVQRLAYAYEAKGHTRDQVATLRHLLGLTLDAEGRAALLTHIGGLLAGRLGAIDEAITSFREALAVVEGHLPALQSLGTLYRQQADWESLLSIYAPEVEGSLPAPMRAARAVEMGELLAGPLARPDEAVRSYQRALALDSELHLAFWELRALLRQLERWEDLTELLVAQAARSRDPRSRNALELELAQVQAGPLERPDLALATLAAVEKPDLTRTAAVARLDLCRRTGRHADRVELLLELANGSEDAFEARSWRLEAALLLEHELEERVRALELYRLVLGDHPDCVMALRGAGRIYHELGRWGDLAALHEHELAVARERADAPMLLFRIGRLFEEHLGKPAEAVDAYSRALERDPTYLPALSALEELARRERRWPDLVEVLEKHAVARSDEVASAEALCRAAEVSDVQLGAPEQAGRLYREALQLDPASEHARRGLLRVYGRLQDWTSLAVLLGELNDEAGGDAARGQWLLWQAWLREHRLGEGPDVAPYQTAATRSPWGRCLRLELTRTLRLTRASGLARWLEALGERGVDPALAAAYLLESVHLREVTGSAEVADRLGAARQAHRRQPGSRLASWTLERTLAGAGAWAELAALYEEEARGELDHAARAIKLSAAAVAYLRAGGLTDAERVAHRCLNFDAHSLSALRVLARVAEEREDWAALAALFDRLAEAYTDQENRLAACLQAAELWLEGVGDEARSLASLWVALTDAPAHAEAFARAERLHRAQGQYGELSALYRARIAATEEPAERAALLHEHARLLRDELDDPNGAIEELEALLELTPADAVALSELADLLMARERWSDAADILGRLIDAAAEAAARREARLRQAEVWLRRLHQPQRARTTLKDQLAEQPGDAEARRWLVEVATAQARWREARGLLEELASEGDAGTRVWATLRLGEVARLGLRDEALSASYERQALELAMDEPDALASLPDDYWSRGDPRERIEVLEGVLDQRADGEGATALRATAARLLLDTLNAPARAVAHLRRSAYAEPGNESVHLLLCQALERGDALEEATNEYRALLGRQPDGVEAYRGLAHVTAQLGQGETAAAAAALAALLDAPTAKETALLRGLEAPGSPAGRLEVESLPLDAEARPFDEVMTLAAPYLDALYPSYPGEALAEDHPASRSARRLGRALGLASVQSSLGQVVEARAGLGEPVPLTLSQALAEHAGEARFRFWVGRALATVADRAVLAERKNDRELSLLFEALTARRRGSPEADELRRQLAKVLPRKLRKQLEDVSLELTTERLAAYRASVQRRADKAGLLLCRHPGVALAELAAEKGTAIEALARSPRLVALASYAVSDDYARRSRALWH